VGTVGTVGMVGTMGTMGTVGTVGTVVGTVVCTFIGAFLKTQKHKSTNISVNLTQICVLS
jgi:hypothetical protein